MKRAHSSGRLPKRSAETGHSAARIKQLEEELAELRPLPALLDAEIAANKNLHDRLMLALDGGRSPAGVLSTLDALAPLAKAAREIDDAFQDGLLNPDDEVGISLIVRGTLCAVRTNLRLRAFRDAARTLQWWREGRRSATPRKPGGSK